MDPLARLKAFDTSGAVVSLWVFKSYVTAAPGAGSAKWVGTTDELDAALKNAITHRIEGIAETSDYDPLAENNEASVLTIGTDETHAHVITSATGAPLPALKASKLKAIQNVKFYAVKLTTGDETLYAVRRTDGSFAARKALDWVNVVFSDDRLDLEPDPVFTLSKHFDFLIFGHDVFIANKAHFETILSYRAAHAAAFSELQQEEAFVSIFSKLGPIIEFVGANKLHLRRAMAISQKGHYKHAAFMASLRANCEMMKLSIAFDEEGRIVPTPESCREIFHALLDHRLRSPLSLRTYDVPSTKTVA